MALYLICYDLSENHKEASSPLRKRLEDFSAKPIEDSVWLLTNPSPGMAKQIGNDLTHNQHIREGDRLLVIEVGRDAASFGLKIPDEEFTKWLTSARF